MDRGQQKVRAPGKLILSGEHAVVYGLPALAIAINRYTEATATWHDLNKTINFKFPDLSYAKSHTYQALLRLQQRIQEQYHAFLRGRCKITEVFKRPFELLQFSVTHLIQRLNVHLPKGVNIQVSSNIPMGCGMGSSAAAIISTLYALHRLFDLRLNQKQQLHLGLETEHLQHGHSSGLDLSLAAQGGCVKFQRDTGRVSRKLPTTWPLYLVNTGKPQCSTGECVGVAESWFRDQGIRNSFLEVTNAIDQAVQVEDFIEFSQGIRQNHQLLQQVGVVPDKVSHFIKEIESIGGAAKVCGAGSVRGEQAGAVLVAGENLELSQLIMRYGYQLQSIRVDNDGVKSI